MAKLPDETALGSLSNPASGRPIATYDVSGYGRGAAAIAEGVQKLAAGINQAGKDFSTQDEQLEVAKAEAEFLTRTRTLNDELSRETDPEKLKDKYEPAYRKAHEDAAAVISNPRTRQLWTLKRADDVQGGIITAGQREFKLTGDKEIAGVQAKLEQLRQQALTETDENKRIQYIDAGNQLIRGLETSGYIDRSTGHARSQKWSQDYAVDWVKAQTPEKRIEMLRGTPITRDQFLDRMKTAENNTGNPAARASTSSAMGDYQFIDSTWLDMVRRYRPDLMEGLSRKQVLELRADPVLSRQMADKFTDENASALKAAGVEATPGNLYLAHFLGAGDAVRVLKAAPGTPVAGLVNDASISANRSVLQGRTTDSVAEWASRKMGSATSGAGPIKFLPEDKRVELLQQSEREQAQTNAQRVQLAQNETKLLGDEYLKEGLSRGAQGTLTPEYVEQIRPYITPDAYKGLLKTLNSPDVEDNPQAIVDLTPRLDSTDPTEFQKLAGAYLTQGKLKSSTYVSLVEKNRAASKDDAPASPYRSGRELVKTTLDPGMLVSGAARAPFALSQSKALTEFDDWAALNPRASRDEAVKQAEDIIRRYQTIDFSANKISVPTSRYFGPKTKTEVKIKDVEEAEANLMRELPTMDKAQAEKEIKLLQTWRDILAREQEAEAARGRNRRQ